MFADTADGEIFGDSGAPPAGLGAAGGIVNIGGIGGIGGAPAVDGLGGAAGAGLTKAAPYRWRP